MSPSRTVGRESSSSAIVEPPTVTEPEARTAGRRVLGLASPTMLVTVVVGVVGFFVPALIGDGNLMTVLTNSIVLGLGALAVGFLINTLGWISFGGAAFSGASGYLFAVVVTSSPKLSVGLAVAIAVVGSTLVSAVVGLVFVRSRALVFTMLTLALGQLLLQVVELHSLSGRTGGTNGLVASFSGTLFGKTAGDLNAASTFWPLAWACVVVAVLLCCVITRSAFGRVLRGIRENEARLRHAGFGTYAPKLAAFVFAGFLGAVSGLLQAVNISFVSPDLFSFATSGMVIIAAIIGGCENPWGPIIGAVVLTELQNQLGSSGDLFLWMGIAVIVVIVLFPRGITGLIDLVVTQLRRGRDGSRRITRPSAADPGNGQSSS